MAEERKQDKQPHQPVPLSEFMEQEVEPVNQEAGKNQNAHWSGNPHESKKGAKLPEAQPDNMPGDTEVDRVNWQRY